MQEEPRRPSSHHVPWEKRPRVHYAREQKEWFFREGCWITELFNSPADPALSVARARVQPGVTTRWHRLEAITERYCILEGHGHVEVEGMAGAEVGPGDVVRIPPGAGQRITNTGDDELVFLALCTPRFVAEAYEDIEPA